MTMPVLHQVPIMALELCLWPGNQPQSKEDLIWAAHCSCGSREVKLWISLTVCNVKDLPSQWTPSNILGPFPPSELVFIKPCIMTPFHTALNTSLIYKVSNTKERGWNQNTKLSNICTYNRHSTLLWNACREKRLACELPNVNSTRKASSPSVVCEQLGNWGCGGGAWVEGQKVPGTSQSSSGGHRD